MKKVHNAISFSQDAWLEPYIMRNTNLRMKADNDFEKDYYKLLNNSFYGNAMENIGGHGDIRLVMSNKKRSILASEPNYHSTKQISENLLITELKLREVFMNKPIYLGQVILDNSKMVMYEFWYDYLRPKCGDKIKLCYMDTDSFIIYVETDDFYKDISNDVNKWFDASNYSKDIDRPLEKGKNKKVIGKFKDELGGLVMSRFSAHRAKTYAFLIDGFTNYDYEKHGVINKKAKGTKKCVIKNKITFNDYVNVLFSGINLLRSQYSFRCRFHEIYTEKINKIALSSNDDKRIQCIDKITTYPYGYCDTSVIIENIIDNTENTNDASIIIENTKDTLVNIENTNDIHVNIENTNDISINTNDISINTENTNANSEIDIIKKEAQAIRERPKLLIEESQTITNSSSNIRNELEIIRKETWNIKKDSDDMNNSSVNRAKKLVEEGRLIRNNFKVLREGSQVIINNCNVLLEKGQDIINNFNDIRNNARKLIEEAQANRKRSEEICEIKKTSRKKLNANVEMMFSDVKKELEQTKNDSYHIKKNIRSIKKEIEVMKNNAYTPKITYVKIEKPHAINNIREEIKVLNKDSANIKNKLVITKKCLNIFNKRERVNRDNINNTNVIIQNIKKGLRKAKKDYNSTINVCKIVIDNNKVICKKRELHKPLVKKNKITINHEIVTMLRRNNVLLVKDMELVLRKFVYEQFLSRKFRGKVTSNGEISLVSQRHRITSIINIVNSKINVTFEKNTKLKGYYTNIHVNTTGIIIENEFSVYNPHTEKTVDKRAYTEICNQR